MMKWETPSFVELKMDSEINSYQDDFRENIDAKEPPQSTPSSGVATDTHGST